MSKRSVRFVSLLAACVGLLLALVACGSQAASPTPTPVTLGSFHPTAEPSRRVTLSAITPDGSLWYTRDDARGGIAWGQLTTGLYRVRDGVTEHYDLARDPHRDHIRVLKAAPDGSLYVALGLGLVRYHDGAWETLLALDGQHRFVFALGIAFGRDQEVWVGGPHGLARFDGERWTEFPVAAVRLAAAPDGSVWATGWDGKEGSNCCLTHVVGDRWVSYSLSDTVSVPAAMLVPLTGCSQ